MISAFINCLDPNVNLLEPPVGITCIMISKVYQLKPWLPRKQFIDSVNKGDIPVYYNRGSIAISLEKFHSLDKVFFTDKLSKCKSVK